MARRARKILSVKIRRAILERDGYKCTDCGVPEKCESLTGKQPRSNLQIHHILEYVNGGSDEPDNLVTLCVKCHHAHDAAHKAKLRDETKARLRAKFRARGYVWTDAAARMLKVPIERIPQLVKSGKLDKYRNPLCPYNLYKTSDLQALLDRSRKAA